MTFPGTPSYHPVLGLFGQVPRIGGWGREGNEWLPSPLLHTCLPLQGFQPAPSSSLELFRSTELLPGSVLRDLFFLLVRVLCVLLSLLPGFPGTPFTGIQLILVVL